VVVVAGRVVVVVGRVVVVPGRVVVVSGGWVPGGEPGIVVVATGGPPALAGCVVVVAESPGSFVEVPDEPDEPDERCFGRAFV
jgi:hypothetical protein